MTQGMTPDEITALVQAGALTHRQAIDIHSAFYGRQPNPPALTLPCEECGTLTPLSHMVSYKLWVPMPGHPGVLGYDEHDQHLCCSQDCAEKQVANCLAFHLRPEAERRVRAAVAAEMPASEPAPPSEGLGVQLLAESPESPADTQGPDGLSADIPEPQETPAESPAPAVPTPAPTQGEGVPGI